MLCLWQQWVSVVEVACYVATCLKNIGLLPPYLELHIQMTHPTLLLRYVCFVLTKMFCLWQQGVSIDDVTCF